MSCQPERQFCAAQQHGQEARRLSCECMTGWKGDDCVEQQPLVCMGDCGCHGVCTRGFCKCEPGFFGADCALTTDAAGQVVRHRCHRTNDAAGNEASVEEPELPPGCRLDPMIFVYELPPQFNVHLVPSPDKGWQRTMHNGAVVSHPSLWPGDGYVGPPELFLWERLLASDHRTLDPDQADFFFVPTCVHCALFPPPPSWHIVPCAPLRSLYALVSGLRVGVSLTACSSPNPRPFHRYEGHANSGTVAPYIRILSTREA